MTTLAEIIAKVKSLSATVDAHLSGGAKRADATSELPAIKSQLEQFATQFSQAEADLGTARQTIGTLQTNLEATSASLATVSIEAQGLKEKVATLETAKAELEAKWKNPAMRESAGAAQLAASQGVTAALPILPQTEAKPTLTGLERVTAAFAAQLAAKQSKAAPTI